MAAFVEYVDGVALFTELKTNSPLPKDPLGKCSAQLVMALIVTRQHFITYSNLNPKNILIAADTQDITLIDFGLAADHSQWANRISNQIYGTPLFMPSENANAFFTGGSLYKSDFVRPYIDWYALGLFFT